MQTQDNVVGTCFSETRPTVPCPIYSDNGTCRFNMSLLHFVCLHVVILSLLHVTVTWPLVCLHLYAVQCDCVMHELPVWTFRCVLHTPFSGPDPRKSFGNEACRFKRRRRNTEGVIGVWVEGMHMLGYRRHIVASDVCSPRRVWIVKVFIKDVIAVEIIVVGWYRNLVHWYNGCVEIEARYNSVFWHLANNWKKK